MADINNKKFDPNKVINKILKATLISAPDPKQSRLLNPNSVRPDPITVTLEKLAGTYLEGCVECGARAHARLLKLPPPALRNFHRGPPAQQS